MPSLREIQLRDPFVLADGGYYHLFGSTDPNIWTAPGVGFDVYRGVAPGAFTEFEGPFPAFRPPAGFWSVTNFWAPEAHPWRGGWYLFATFRPIRGRRGTAILRSDDPMGPYQPWSDGPVTPPQWECLDGTFHVDDAGDPWLVFCHEWQQVGDGEVCACRLSSDLREPAGEPVLLFTASQAPWAAPLANRPPGSYVTDGPWVYRDSAGRLRMLWSSFGADGRYSLGVASSAGGILGPWSQSRRPVYGEDGGHGMLFTGPEGTRYLAVHTPNRTPLERPIFVAVAETPEGLAVTGEVIPAGEVSAGRWSDAAR